MNVFQAIFALWCLDPTWQLAEDVGATGPLQALPDVTTPYEAVAAAAAFLELPAPPDSDIAQCIAAAPYGVWPRPLGSGQ